MSERIDFVENLTIFVLTTKASESEIATDDHYKKINKKSKIKVIKLNSNNYQKLNE